MEVQKAKNCTLWKESSFQSVQFFLYRCLIPDLTVSIIVNPLVFCLYLSNSIYFNMNTGKIIVFLVI